MPGEKRVQVGVRIGGPGIVWLDTVAATHDGITRSDVIRAALIVARRHAAEVTALLKERT